MSADNWAQCPKCGGDETLREDYEFYMDPTTGEFSAAYEGHCECGFEFTFKHKEPAMKNCKVFGCPKCRSRYNLELQPNARYCFRCGTALSEYMLS